MMIPQLQYALSSDGQEAAFSATLVPTFDAVAPQDAYEVLEDEKPVQISNDADESFHFFFVIDRSASMGSKNRLKLAKEAMDIFVRSLPFGCTFSIISFGSHPFKALEYYNLSERKSTKCIIYDDKSRDFALSNIKYMEADFGGTDILTPLIAC